MADKIALEPLQIEELFDVMNAVVGPAESITVTIELQFEVFPEASVPERTTELGPIFEQLKEVFDKAKLITEQLSELPLFISEELIAAFPLASR